MLTVFNGAMVATSPNNKMSKLKASPVVFNKRQTRTPRQNGCNTQKSASVSSFFKNNSPNVTNSTAKSLKERTNISAESKHTKQSGLVEKPLLPNASNTLAQNEAITSGSKSNNTSRRRLCITPNAERPNTNSNQVTNKISIETSTSVEAMTPEIAARASAVATAILAGAIGSASKTKKRKTVKIPTDVLDDLASRFIINIPAIEFNDMIRLCFQIELAHWFYLDFFCASEENGMRPCGMKGFAEQIFEHIPFLRQHLSMLDTLLDDWKNYKLSVPTYGAILISEDLKYCLLVQSFYTKSSWGFPKGKVNEHEHPVHCASREVYEETGYDISDLIVPTDYIEDVINYQYTRLYIVRNVSLDTQFSPRTRNEIRCCDWFPIDSLPSTKSDAMSKTRLGLNANSFFMIIPFVKRLRQWVTEKRAGIDASSANAHENTSSLSPDTRNAAATSADFERPSEGPKLQSMSCKKNTKQQQQQKQNDAKGVLNGACIRSQRQRHKSMGDLDAPQTASTGNNNVAANQKTVATTANNRHSTGITTNAKKSTTAALKRSLFNNSTTNGTSAAYQEKVIMPYEMKNKKISPKQQQQQQQQQQQPIQIQQATGRTLAKSQSEKVACGQQTPNKNNCNSKNSNGSNTKMRLQRQHSAIVSSSNTAGNNNTVKRNSCLVTTEKYFAPDKFLEPGLIACVPTESPTKSCYKVTTEVKISNKTIKAKAATTTSMQTTEALTVKDINTPMSPAIKALSSSSPSSNGRKSGFKNQITNTKFSSADAREHQKEVQALAKQVYAAQTAQALIKPNAIQKHVEAKQEQKQQTKGFKPDFESWTNFTFTKNLVANVFF